MIKTKLPRLDKTLVWGIVTFWIILCVFLGISIYKKFGAIKETIADIENTIKNAEEELEKLPAKEELSLTDEQIKDKISKAQITLIHARSKRSDFDDWVPKHLLSAKQFEDESQAKLNSKDLKGFAQDLITSHSLGDKIDCNNIRELITTDPGSEPDPVGPNSWREEWRIWNIKNQIYNHEYAFRYRKLVDCYTKMRDHVSENRPKVNKRVEQAEKWLQHWKSRLPGSELLDPFDEDRAKLKAKLKELQKSLRENSALQATLALKDGSSLLIALVIMIGSLFRALLVSGKLKHSLTR